MSISKWEDICKGSDCGRKEQCRRHTYYVLAEMRGYKARVFANRCRVGSNQDAFIHNESEAYMPMPMWWAP